MLQKRRDGNLLDLALGFQCAMIRFLAEMCMAAANAARYKFEHVDLFMLSLLVLVLLNRWFLKDFGKFWRPVRDPWLERWVIHRASGDIGVCRLCSWRDSSCPLYLLRRV